MDKDKKKYNYYTVTTIYYDCLKSSPGFIKGERYDESIFKDSEYDEFSIFDPNDYPKHFKRIENKKRIRQTKASNMRSGSLADILCQMIPTETPLYDSFKTKSKLIEWTTQKE